VGTRLQAAGIPVLRFPFTDAATAERAIRIAAPDIFHSFAHKNGVDIHAAYAAAVPVILGSRVNVREWDPLMQVGEWERQRNRLTDHIIAVSQAAALVCEQVEGVERDHITVIHSGVPMPSLEQRAATVRDELGIGPDTQLLGYVAHYRPEKDHEMLLRAFRFVLSARPNTHLVCCGIASSEMRSRLAALARELEVQSKVSLLDSRPELTGFYSGLDLYVHSSCSEGFSNSILEAMAHGLPIVATNAGGTPEAVRDGITGLLMPCGHPAVFAQAIIELLADRQRLKAFGEAGRKRIECCFSVDRMLARYADFYEKMRAAAAPVSLRNQCTSCEQA
jgi:glycosyltransferase involved in cell wall biosynthesis